MGAADSNGPGVQRGSARQSRPRPPRAGSIPQAGLRAREWKPAPPMPRLPMRLHSGVLRHLTSPTVAGAAPALQLAKAIRAPDSRLNHRNSGSHLRGAHGSRIGQGRLRGLRQAAKRNASPRVWMANGRFLLPPGKGARGADEGAERSLMPLMEAACRGFRHGRMPATERHLADASGLRPGRTLTPTPALAARAPMARKLCLLSPTGEGFRAELHWRVQDFRVMEVTCRGGSVAGDWRRAAQGCAAAASQTGCLPSRRADLRPRCRFLPKPVPTGSASPYPPPPPRSAPRPDPRLRRTNCAYSPEGRGTSSRTSLACSRFPGHGSDVPRRQRGRGLAESGTGMCRDGESDRMSAEPKSRSPAALTP
ncbi:hypothetical protein FHT07_003084 [Xanthomonas arboricola]|nr:hypothetical protein [Xanthomonas arboricola]